MARRKLKEKNIRKLTRMGGGRSMGLTLPIEILHELKWRERQKIKVRKSGSKIILEDWKK
jgi:antitoxin component of MazEF toxin-antitoxin module